jgi:hypothetical protein
MRIPWTRLSGSIAFATLTTWLVVRDAVDAATIPGFLLATLGVYLAWPAFEARLPAGYTWTVTRWGIVIALLLNVAFVVASLLLRGEPLEVTTVAPRLVIGVLATFAIAMVISLVHAMGRQSNRSS